MTTHCPACTALCEGATVEISDHEYGLSQHAHFTSCSACGTLFQSPMPSDAELATYYPADYHSMTHSGLLNCIRNQIRVRRLIQMAQEKGPILDFGCGDGAFLVQASDTITDRELWGFEISERTEILELKKGSVRIVRGELGDLLDVLPKCSLITMNHVIEHLPDPFTTVSALTRKLLPRGVVEGQTPAADSLEHRIFDKKWSGYHAPRHTVVFSRPGLRILLERCGLTSPAIVGAFNPAGIAASLGSLGHENGGTIHRYGAKWLMLVTMAAALAPLDLYFGQPGIVNFAAVSEAK